MVKQQRKKRSGPEIKDEFEQEVIDVARVTRVMAGGKRMRFRACLAIGDKRGRVGLGIAKGGDVSMAISKAAASAKKNLIKVNLTESGSIAHAIRLQRYSAKILLKPAPAGTGIIAGSVLRQILELVGLRDVVGKIMGTSNKINNAKAALDALASLKEEKKFEKGEKKTDKAVEAVDDKKKAKDKKDLSLPSFTKALEDK